MEQLGQFIINHWAMWGMLLLVLLFILMNELMSQKKRTNTLSPHALVSLMNDKEPVIIDLRDKELFQQGHIIGSIHLSHDALEKKMDHYKNKPLVLVCAKGIQSNSIATKWRHQGFSELWVLAGGMTAWQESDLPLVKGK